MIQNKY